MEKFNKMSIKFKAFVLEKKEKKIQGSIRKISFNDLMPGNVLVKVSFSSFNYKDGLAISGSAPIIKNYPMIPGVDFVGHVIKSNHRRFKKGDKVICTGWGVGESHYGGFSEFAQVNGDWLVNLPKGLSERESMILGSAGFTAMLCVDVIREKINQNFGPVIVTGASGGVGCISTHLLSALNFDVHALSGAKNTEILKKMGARSIINRNDFLIANKPLEKVKWAGAIDTVGSDILSTILSQTMYDGIIASTGLAKGFELNTTVYPFILRNICLAGVDSVYVPYRKRKKTWENLTNLISKKILRFISEEKKLSDLKEVSKEILKGKINGRVIINVNL